MQIESIIKREKGHTVDLGGQLYSFLPDTDPPYVAAVEDPGHLGILLAITDGYRVHGAQQSKPAAAKIDAAPVVELLGSELHPAEFEIKGATYTLDDVVDMAHKASGLSADAWNQLSEGERADLIDAELDKLENAKNRDELAAEYEAKFGKKPHHRLSAEKIQAAIDGGAEE